MKKKLFGLGIFVVFLLIMVPMSSSTQSAVVVDIVDQNNDCNACTLTEIEKEEILQKLDEFKEEITNDLSNQNDESPESKVIIPIILMILTFFFRIAEAIFGNIMFLRPGCILAYIWVIPLMMLENMFYGIYPWFWESYANFVIFVVRDFLRCPWAQDYDF